MCSFATNHFLYDLSVLMVPCGLESASPWDTASRMAEGDQKQRKLFVFQLSSPRPQVRVHLSAADKWSHGIEGTAQPVSGNVAPRLLLPNCLTYAQAASVSSGVWMDGAGGAQEDSEYLLQTALLSDSFRSTPSFPCPENGIDYHFFYTLTWLTQTDY